MKTSDRTMQPLRTRGLGATGTAMLACFSLLGFMPACHGDPTSNDSLFGVPRQRSSAQLRSFDSCEQLTEALRANVGEQARVALLQMLDQAYLGGNVAVGAEDGAFADDSAPRASEADGADAASGSADNRTEGVDFSGTNNQEAGVDEADIAKTDGYFIYTLNGSRLEILGVPEFGELTHAGSAPIEGYPTQLLIGNSRAVVFSTVYPDYLDGDDPLRAAVAVDSAEPYGWQRSTDLTKLTVINVTDAAAPVVEREVYIEGYYQTARRVDGTVRMVSHGEINIPGLTYWPEMPDTFYLISWNTSRAEEMWRRAVFDTIEANDALLAHTPLEDFVPRIYERMAGSDGLVLHTFTDADCADFATAEDSTARGITSILSLDLFADTFSFDADHILSNSSLVYASDDTLIIAEPANDWWWYWDNEDWQEAANLHRFDIGTAGQTVYTGSGRVDGTILNQFSISEYEGAVRVASTTGRWNRWWLNDATTSDNHIFVLEGDNALEVVGQVGGIGGGEHIWSSRFVGDKAYLVTFRSIDPLWTIDLTDKTNPQVIGELEVPGVSTYIHPIGHYLLTIGYDGDANGLNWSVQVALFDVGDFSNPTLAQKLSLAPTPDGNGWSNAWSEASYEHKAFQYWAPLSMLALPMSSYREVYRSTDTATSANKMQTAAQSSGSDSGSGSDSESASTESSTPATEPSSGDGDGSSSEDAPPPDDSDVYYGYDYEYSSRLELIRVDEDAGSLSEYGAVDHSGLFNEVNRCWWNSRDIRRSFFLGDYIYAISDRGVTAHRVSDMSQTASVTLQGSIEDDTWCY